MPMCPECQALSCVCEKAREMANSWHLSGLDEPQLVKLERDFMTALGGLQRGNRLMPKTLELVRRLHALLEGPHQLELWSWNKAVGDAKRELRDQLTQELMPPPVDYAALVESILRPPTLRLVSAEDEGTD